jgi:hypothetical protein
MLIHLIYVALLGSGHAFTLGVSVRASKLVPTATTPWLLDSFVATIFTAFAGICSKCLPFWHGRLTLRLRH